MMNREKINKLPEMQISFIDSICIPIYQAFSKLFPDELGTLLEGCISNRAIWSELAKSDNNAYIMSKHQQQLARLQALTKTTTTAQAKPIKTARYVINDDDIIDLATNNTVNANTKIPLITPQNNYDKLSHEQIVLITSIQPPSPILQTNTINAHNLENFISLDSNKHILDSLCRASPSSNNLAITCNNNLATTTTITTSASTIRASPIPFADNNCTVTINKSDDNNRLGSISDNQQILECNQQIATSDNRCNSIAIQQIDNNNRNINKTISVGTKEEQQQLDIHDPAINYQADGYANTRTTVRRKSF